MEQLENHSCVLETETYHQTPKRDNACPPMQKGVNRTGSNSPLKPHAGPWM